MLKRQSRSRRTKTGDSRGQALVEFSLVILVFMTIFTGMLEFGIAFTVKMQVSWASRDAAIVASESGSSPATADCAILSRIDLDIMAPATRSNPPFGITEVDIFWAKADGSVKNGAIETYVPGGSLAPQCPATLQWTRTKDAYPGSSRCAFINSTGGSTSSGCLTNHNGPDEIGVTVVYKYAWSTPLPSLVGLGGTGFTFTETSLTTIEAIPAT